MHNHSRLLQVVGEDRAVSAIAMKVKGFFVVLITFCAVLKSIKADECGTESVLSDDKSVSFPWTVRLVNRRTNTFFCVGSLISAKHVLSGKLNVFRVTMCNAQLCNL